MLAESDLNFKKALDFALAMETAERNVLDLQATKPRPPAPVLALRRTEETRRTLCYRCGGEHLATDCRFKGIECHHCKETGHLARVCRSRAQSTAQKGRAPYQQ